MPAARLFPRVALASTLVATLGSTLAFAAEPPATVAQPLATTKPFKVSAAAAQGPVFTVKSAVKGSGPDGETTDVLLLRSKDGKVEMGLYEATASETDIGAYEEDEFMFFLAGGVKLTSADGSVLEVKAGEGCVIPKGWKGHWSTAGYKKYYVTYSGGAKPK